MSKINLKNVRLSFPSLFHQSEFNGQKGKFEATFLIDKKDEATKKILDAAIEAALTEAKIKVPSDKICLKDGDEVEYDGYAGNWSVKASNAKRPIIIDRDKSAVSEEDGKIYAGCYVNAIVDIWIQNNAYGKRVNANLYGVQFVSAGEAFGDGVVASADDFDDLEGDL